MQVPHQISPPINDVVLLSTNYNHEVSSSRPDSADLSNCSGGYTLVPASSSNHNTPFPTPSHLASNLRAYLTATPGHQKTKGMDSDENPFRPDGNLSHEVEPIVEVYKHRPFPGSPERHPSEGGFRSPTPGGAAGHDLADGILVSSGGKLEHVVRLEKDNLCFQQNNSNVAPPSDNTISTPNGKSAPANKEADVQQRLVTPGKAQTPQIVHVGGAAKRKKCCGSCSVQ